MAKRKAPALSPEAQAANAAGAARREKEKKARQDNAEKQRRFREGMKAEGFKQVLLWALPCPADVRERMAAADFRQVPAWEASLPPGEKRRSPPPGTVKVAVPIRESSLGVAAKNQTIREALDQALAVFLGEIKKSGKDCGDVGKDFQALIRPLGGY
jgi:hypothetical protein